MEVQVFALSIAEHLPYGSVRRTQCPACGERDFVVGRESSRVWWNCFRASCGIKGRTGGYSLGPPSAEEVRALARIRIYEGAFEPFTDADRRYFMDRFEINPGNAWAAATEHDEYVFAVRGPNQVVRGYVVRQPVWKGVPSPVRVGQPKYTEGELRGADMPKTKLYVHSIGPLLAWYPPIANEFRETDWNHIVLVEDQISAMKVARYCSVRAVALLGNGINIEGIRDLFRAHPKRVTIALDPGADGQAQNIAKKYWQYFEKVRVVPLEADPKDIPSEELPRELGI